jgi:hypothetical protein
MSNKQTIYQVVTGVTFEGLYVNKQWKAFTTREAANEYASILDSTDSMEYDYVGIVETELE